MKFDRAELLQSLVDECDDDCYGRLSGCAMEHFCERCQAFEALSLALAVVDEAAPKEIDGKGYPCAICGMGMPDTTDHMDDCPVRACAEAGLTK